MKKLIFFLTLLFTVWEASGQAISRQQADSLIKVLPLTSGTLLIEGQLALANFYISKDGAIKADMDTAVNLINQLKASPSYPVEPWVRAGIFLVEARISRKNGNTAAEQNLVSQALELAKAPVDELSLGRVYYKESRFYTGIDDISQLTIRVSLVEAAVKLLGRSPDKKEYATDLQMLADLYNLQGKFRESNKQLQACLNIYKSIHHKSLQGVYVLFCKNYDYLANYQQALYYGLLAIKACRETNDNGPQLCEIENAVGSTCYYLKEFDNASQHYYAGLQIADKLNNVDVVHDLTLNLNSALLQANKPQKALLLLNKIKAKYPDIEKGRMPFATFYLATQVALKNYPAAKKYYDECKRQLADAQRSQGYADRLYTIMIKYLMAVENYPDARHYNDLLSQDAEKNHIDFQRAQCYSLYASIDSARADYKSAFFYLWKFKALNDSIFNEKKAKQIHELEITYKTKEKDDSIELLRQRAKLQQDDLSKTERLKNESIAAIIILLIAGVAFIKQYRNKQKAYRVIAHQNDVITNKNEEITDKNTALESLVQEKEYLLMEIHHRVKNNLHTVLGFLNLQSKYLTGEALAAVKISRQRIYAMSLIHQKLYLAEDVKTIDIHAYLHEFVAYFQECLEPGSTIRFVLDIEALRLPVTKAIPVGLIVNEAITNSVKYAFPYKDNGEIAISLHSSDNLVRLSIGDNGIGISRDANNTDFNSLGIKLIKGLCNDLDGEVNFESAGGTKIVISFNAVLL